jgi:hypothetical protein
MLRLIPLFLLLFFGCQKDSKTKSRPYDKLYSRFDTDLIVKAYKLINDSGLEQVIAITKEGVVFIDQYEEYTSTFSKESLAYTNKFYVSQKSHYRITSVSKNNYKVQKSHSSCTKPTDAEDTIEDETLNTVDLLNKGYKVIDVDLVPLNLSTSVEGCIKTFEGENFLSTISHSIGKESIYNFGYNQIDRYHFEVIPDIKIDLVSDDLRIMYSSFKYNCSSCEERKYVTSKLYRLEEFPWTDIPNGVPVKIVILKKNKDENDDVLWVPESLPAYVELPIISVVQDDFAMEFELKDNEARGVYKGQVKLNTPSDLFTGFTYTIFSKVLSSNQTGYTDIETYDQISNVNEWLGFKLTERSQVRITLEYIGTKRFDKSLWREITYVTPVSVPSKNDIDFNCSDSGSSFDIDITLPSLELFTYDFRYEVDDKELVIPILNGKYQGEIPKDINGLFPILSINSKLRGHTRSRRLVTLYECKKMVSFKPFE